MDKELDKELLKLSEIEIQSLLKSNILERELRKEIYALYTIKRIERLIIESLPLIAGIGIASGVVGIIGKLIKKTK